MNQQELEKYLWGAAVALRGTIDAGDYKQYIAVHEVKQEKTMAF
jgi:hypothetical protein